MSAQGVEITENISAISSRHWDELIGGEGFNLSSAWLRAVETHRGQHSFYVVSRGGDATLKGSAVAFTTEDSAASNRDSLNRLTRVDHVLASALGVPGALETEPEGDTAVLRRLLPNLSCGGWTLTNSVLPLAPGLSGEERTEVAAALLDALHTVAEKFGARSLCFPYVEERNRELRALLLENGFAEFPSSAHSSLELVWDSFDAYVEHFPYNRRRAVKKEVAKLAEAGVTFRVVPLDEPMTRRLLPLGTATVKRHQGFVAEDQILVRLRMLSEVGCRVILAEQDGAIRGFGVVAEWRDHLHARMVGFDYGFQDAAGLPVYFGIMYEQIRYAIARGLRVIEYATTTDRAKAARGGRSHPQYGYLKVTDPEDAAALSRLIASAAG